MNSSSSLSSSSNISAPQGTPPTSPSSPAPATSTPRRQATQDIPAPIRRAQHFERFTAWPVFVSSIVFFAASLALLAGSIHDDDLRRTTLIVAVVTYGVVLLEFLIRLFLARQAAREFFKRYWFEPIGLLLPLLRPFVIVVYLWRIPAFRRSGTTLRARLLITTLLFMFMFVYFISSAVWLVERGSTGANIVNLDDAIWWGFATLSTVGYGDFVPITALGRVLAVCLMMGGIAIVGTTTALVVSVLAEQLTLRKDALVDAPGDAAGAAGAAVRTDEAGAAEEGDAAEEAGAGQGGAGQPPTTEAPPPN